MSELKNQISEILRQVEADLGTSALSNMALLTIVEALRSFKSESVEDSLNQFKEIMTLLKGSKPRIGILIFHFCEIWEEIQNRKETLDSPEELNHIIKDYVHLLLNENEKDSKEITKHGLTCIEDGDSILIHSHSRTVLNLIEIAYKQMKKIRVVLAEQEKEKTHEMILFLQERKIPFVVVPEYMLSHVEKEVSKVFLGAITFNNQYNFITDAGTNSVVAEFHHAGVPIYMFLGSKKFSLWDASKKEQTYKLTQKRADAQHGHHDEKHPELAVTYDRIKFSHDRVPHDLVDHIITEEGIYTPKELIKVFDRSYKDHATWRKKYFD